MWDNDGEFLLIEAAYALPKWLKPETASNRVWLLNGVMHVVPLPTAAAPDLPSFPSLQQARQVVQGDQVSTAAGASPILHSLYLIAAATMFFGFAIRDCAKSAEYYSRMTSQSRNYLGRVCCPRETHHISVATLNNWPVRSIGLRQCRRVSRKWCCCLPRCLLLLLNIRGCCCAEPKIQQAVNARLKGYPQKANRQMHRARVVVPAKVAAVLRADPGLAGPAVDAFYSRDVDDMQAAARMRHFAPEVMPKPSMCSTISALWATAMPQVSVLTV